MDARGIVAGLVVVGFLCTATNGALAYRSAKERLTRYGRRIQTLKKKTDGGSAQPPTIDDSTADDAVQRVLHALQSSRTSLLLALLGLLISTVAAVWALFLPA